MANLDAKTLCQTRWELVFFKGPTCPTNESHQSKGFLGGSFKGIYGSNGYQTWVVASHFRFSPLPGEMMQFD